MTGLFLAIACIYIIRLRWKMDSLKKTYLKMNDGEVAELKDQLDTAEKSNEILLSAVKRNKWDMPAIETDVVEDLRKKLGIPLSELNKPTIIFDDPHSVIEAYGEPAELPDPERDWMLWSAKEAQDG